jgi:hypothetical protein
MSFLAMWTPSFCQAGDAVRRRPATRRTALHTLPKRDESENRQAGRGVKGRQAVSEQPPTRR